MDVTRPYEFIGFGAVDVTRPYEFIGFGAVDVTRPYEAPTSALRPAGFWPDCYRESTHIGRRADFGVFPVAVQPKSGPKVG